MPHGMFQVDGNLGATAGMMECLLQSHVGLHFLPALPVSWKEGSVRGLRARGGYEVDIKWSAGKLSEAEVRPKFGGPVEVIGDMMEVTCGSVRIPTVKTDTGFAFDADAGGSYTLVPG
jgi:alpha-L-fucosidase 2